MSVKSLIHIFKAKAWPRYVNAPSRRADAIGFRIEAAHHFTSSMHQRLDLTQIYRDPLRGLPTMFEGQPPRPVPTVCKWTLHPLPCWKEDAA